MAIERATVRLEAVQRIADGACGRRPARTAFPERAGRRASASTVSASSGRRASSPTPSYDPESRVMNTSTEGFGIREATERRGGDSVT